MAANTVYYFPHKISFNQVRFNEVRGAGKLRIGKETLKNASLRKYPSIQRLLTLSSTSLPSRSYREAPLDVISEASCLAAFKSAIWKENINKRNLGDRFLTDIQKPSVLTWIPASRQDT